MQIDIPGIGLVDFPDDMTPEAVNAAARKLHQTEQRKAEATTEAQAPRPESVSMFDSLTGRDGGPSTYGFGEKLVSGAVDAVRNIPRTIRGLSKINPSEIPSAIVSGVKERVSDYANDPLGTIYEDPLSFLGDASIVAGGLASAPARAVGRGASNAAARTISGVRKLGPIAADAGTTVGKALVSRKMPLTGPILSEWDKARTARAFSEVDAPSNVAKARQSVFDVSKNKNVALGADDIEDVLAQLAAEDLPASVGGSKTLRAGQNLPVVNPQRTSGMVSTQPDKWGATSIHQAEDFVDRSRLVDRARPVQKAALSDDAFTRNVTGDPARQQLVRELLRAESDDLGGSLTKSGRSMFTPEEASMFENALKQLRPVSDSAFPESWRPFIRR